METQGVATGCVDSGYAYIAIGDRFLVADVAGDTALVVATVTTSAKAISVSGQYAYVGHDNGLTVFDISDPANPVEKGSLTGTKVTCLHAQSSTVYVGFNTYPDKGLGIVDASEPMHPTRTGFVQTKITIGSHTWFKNPEVLDVEGNYAYVGCVGSASLFVIDVTNPASPTITGYNEFITDLSFDISSLDVEAQYAFMTVSAGPSLGLYVLDVSDKAAPAVATVLDEPWDASHIAASGDTLYVAAVHKLFVYWFPDPHDLRPVLLGSDITCAGLFRIFDSGKRLYGVKDNTLHILDVSDPGALVSLGEYVTAKEPIQEVFVLGDYAYLLLSFVGQGILEIVNVSNPASPTKVGEYTLPGRARDLYVSEGSTYAYVAYYASGTNQGFQILDVSDPTRVKLLGSATTPGTPICIWVEQNLLCIGSNTFSEAGPTWFLDAYNVEDKTAPST